MSSVVSGLLIIFIISVTECPTEMAWSKRAVLGSWSLQVQFFLPGRHSDWHTPFRTLERAGQRLGNLLHMGYRRHRLEPEPTQPSKAHPRDTLWAPPPKVSTDSFNSASRCEPIVQTQESLGLSYSNSNIWHIISATCLPPKGGTFKGQVLSGAYVLWGTDMFHLDYLCRNDRTVHILTIGITVWVKERSDTQSPLWNPEA